MTAVVEGRLDSLVAEITPAVAFTSLLDDIYGWWAHGGGAQCIEGLMAGVPTRRLLWELAHANGVRGDALSVSGDCALHHTLVQAPTGLAALAAVCAYVALAEHKLGQRYVDIRMRRSSYRARPHRSFSRRSSQWMDAAHLAVGDQGPGGGKTASA